MKKKIKSLLLEHNFLKLLYQLNFVLLPVVSSTLLLCGELHGKIFLIDLNHTEKIHFQYAHLLPVTDLLVLSNNSFLSFSFQPIVHLWKITNDNNFYLLRSIQISSTGIIQSIALPGEKIASICCDGIMVIWKAKKEDVFIDYSTLSQTISTVGCLAYSEAYSTLVKLFFGVIYFIQIEPFKVMETTIKNVFVNNF